MGFLGIEVWFEIVLEKPNEQVCLLSAVGRPGGARCCRVPQDQPLREHEPVVMLTRQGDKALVALHVRFNSQWWAARGSNGGYLIKTTRSARSMRFRFEWGWTSLSCRRSTSIS